MMNRRITLLGGTLLCGIAFLISCNNESKEIQTVAQGYLDAMGNYKPAEARPYSTQQTCDVTLSFFESVVAQTDPAIYANNIPATITLGDIAIDDTLAEVAFHKSTPSMEQDGTLHCVKRDGRWLVNEVIAVPGLVRSAVDTTTVAARTFDKETIEEMRKNSSQKGKLKLK